VQFFGHAWVSGVWCVLIGMFLNNAAKSGFQQILIREALQGESIRRFMNVNPIVVPPTIDLRRWVDNYVYQYHHRAFPVVVNGILHGVIATDVLNGIPRADWDRRTVGDVMQTDLSAVKIAPTADALEAFEKMMRGGTSRLVVADGVRLIGLISLKDLLSFLSLKLDLEGGDESSNRWDTVPANHEPVFHA
jgi:CBS domain-containing protein